MKTIVVSAVNLVNAGPLTILNQCLSFLSNNFSSSKEYSVIALVHNKENCHFKNITYLEYKYPKKNYLLRMFFEYIHSYFISKKLNPYLWLSLHDMTPNVLSKKRVVYCHNALPFYKIRPNDLLDVKRLLVTLLYKYAYAINIRCNDFVVVQQEWMRNEFQKMFRLDRRNIIVSYPERKVYKKCVSIDDFSHENFTLFFYPAFPREFKNFEIICEAVKILEKDNSLEFSVIITLSGNENSYAKKIYKKYSCLEKILFKGILSYNEMIDNYKKCDCLLFPSKLETWGLPISEFSFYNKPMIISDLPYAHEASYNSKSVYFFDPNDANDLANAMKHVIIKDYSIFNRVSMVDISKPLANSWGDLFNLIL
jgi:glycosyltransferase involved in cell wall biosynthesis